MFTTRNPSEAVAAGTRGRGDAAYGPSSVDSSTRGKKQNVLWMAVFRLGRRLRLRKTAHLLRDKIKVDRWRFNV
jgi:hypothetical protein